MKFSKMHGAGNDYVYVNCFEEKIDDPCALAAFVSRRHFGVCSDGLICICPSEIADFKMMMYNSDGTYGGMCGNGIRCVGKYVYDKGLTDKDVVTVEAAGEVKTLWLNIKDGAVETIRVNMGAPKLESAKIPVAMGMNEVIDVPVKVGEDTYNITCVSMGNPHCVTFVDDVDALDLPVIGPMFENHEIFPERTNTEFVQFIDENTLKMRVWERGSEETLACGTGSCASLVAAVLAGKTQNTATLKLRGGELSIEWDREENIVYMTGPAEFVFDGELYIK